MVKKICSTILSLLLLCTVCLPVLTVGAEGVVVDVPEVTVTVFQVDVNITVARRDTLTLKVYQLDDVTNTPVGNPIYVGVSAPAPTPVEVTTQEGGQPVIRTYYQHAFPAFQMDREALTGDYRVVVANAYNTDFQFINKRDKIIFYNALAGTASGAMEAKLGEGVAAGYLPYVDASYTGLASAVKNKVNVGLEIYPFPALTLDPLADDADVLAFETELRAEYERLMQAASLEAATDGTTFDAAFVAATALGLDGAYYANANVALRPDPQTVYDRYAAIAPEDYTAYKVQNAFDMANLLAVIDSFDAGTITAALAYYDGKDNNSTPADETDDTVTLDTTYSASFAPATLNTLSNNLKGVASQITTKTDLETQYYNLSYQIAYALAQGGGTEDEGDSGRLTGGSLGGTTRPAAKPETTKVEFSDVAADHWAATAIEYLAGKGVVSGKGDGKFYPDDLVTREEFTKIMVEAFRLHNKDAKADFADVAPERWSYSYIASALEAGLITGVSETEFAPAAYISRQDMAVIIYRAAKLLGVNLSGNATFADSAAIASYAKEAVAKLAGAGIINGVENNRFAPTELVTRAQAAKIVYELAMKNGGIM